MLRFLARGGEFDPVSDVYAVRSEHVQVDKISVLVILRELGALLRMYVADDGSSHLVFVTSSEVNDTADRGFHRSLFS